MTVPRAEYLDPDDDERRAVAALDPRHTELRAIVGELPPTVDRAVRSLLEDFAAGASVHLAQSTPNSRPSKQQTYSGCRATSSYA